MSIEQTTIETGRAYMALYEQLAVYENELIKNGKEITARVVHEEREHMLKQARFLGCKQTNIPLNF